MRIFVAWVLTQENLFWLETEIIVWGQAMYKCREVDTPLFGWYFVPFCIYFVGRIHIYCRSTISQLCEKVENCIIFVEDLKTLLLITVVINLPWLW